jgi:2-iminobutanoate/2-iminopropanoate deaminase
VRRINPGGSAPPVGGYSHGVATGDALLFISGQTPEDAGGAVSPEPAEQLRQVWANVKAVLEAAGAGIVDLVHVRTYLADRSHRGVNTEVRREVLGSHEPALTVVICELFEPGWVAEIEAVARLRREGRA